jgi:hypothetical protein
VVAVRSADSAKQFQICVVGYAATSASGLVEAAQAQHRDGHKFTVVTAGPKRLACRVEQDGGHKQL